MYPISLPKERLLFWCRFFPSTLSFFIYHHPLGSLHLSLHLLQKKSVGRVAGRAAAKTADGMTEQNSLSIKWEVHRAVSWVGECACNYMSCSM
jgi:hypothetical protein